jgi:hypothetical protein
MEELEWYDNTRSFLLQPKGVAPTPLQLISRGLRQAVRGWGFVHDLAGLIYAFIVIFAASEIYTMANVGIVEHLIPGLGSILLRVAAEVGILGAGVMGTLPLFAKRVVERAVATSLAVNMKKVIVYVQRLSLPNLLLATAVGVFVERVVLPWREKRRFGWAGYLNFDESY